MKSSEVIISVIVPVYNAEKYLKRCVDSILSQSFSDFELLLIDDGSSDLSGLFCDEYAIADKRVSAFHTDNRTPQTSLCWCRLPRSGCAPRPAWHHGGG